jgi:hypothetical protein
VEDPTTVALNLTFFGTLGVAFLMFVGLFLIFVTTLVLAGLGRLLAAAIMALFGGRHGSAEPAAPRARPLQPKTLQPKALQPKTMAAGREPAQVDEDWAAAVAQADARARERQKQPRPAVLNAPPAAVRAARASAGAPARPDLKVSPLVEATAPHSRPLAVQAPFAKPAEPGPAAVLDTGSLAVVSGHRTSAQETPPAVRRSA